MGVLYAQYLRGIELFNAGKFFECHEELEEIWLKTDGIEREFLHALIQVAAALHHLQNGNLKGAKSVYERARRKFETMPPIAMRLDTAAFTQELDRFFSAALDSQNSSSPLPQIKLEDKS
ncbi:MAG: DUF309 domain-containing protein [Acidobacteria bacterium]|nr:DUF309 domain-containing protein [Acidobacteriota bacterium]MCI0660254.1 DUF309 domain-containing protein [Acidobacteriota bacterium]